MQTACKRNMTCDSIQHMLHLGWSMQWFSSLDLSPDSPIPISEPEPEVDVSLTELVSEGSTVATAVQVDPQYHLYKITRKLTTSTSITDDYVTEFPQTLISYWAIFISKGKYYKRDSQSCQENVCSDCSVDVLQIWNVKRKEQGNTGDIS